MLAGSCALSSKKAPATAMRMATATAIRNARMADPTRIVSIQMIAKNIASGNPKNAGSLRSGGGLERGEARRFGRVVRGVDVEERIDRLGRPVGHRNAVARGPSIDLAQVFRDDRVTQ